MIHLISLDLVLEATIVMLILLIISIKAKFVDLSGLISSFFVGYLIYILGGRIFFIPLLVFFVVSGLLTRYRYDEKRLKGVAEEKMGARGWRNVLANGGVGLTMVFINSFYSKSIEPSIFAAYLGAVTTAYADTLATEIGLLYPKDPRLITNMKPVSTGTPGGVSPYGTAAQLLSVITISPIVTMLLPSNDKFQLFLNIFALLLIAGFLGSFLDSVLGATIQGIYRCEVCGKLTEKRFHCGTEAKKVKGSRYVDNNVVNLIATIFGATISYILVSYGFLKIPIA